MEVVQLASKALRSPHPYDPSYEGEHTVRQTDAVVCMRAYLRRQKKMKFVVLFTECQRVKFQSKPDPHARDLRRQKVKFVVLFAERKRVKFW